MTYEQRKQERQALIEHLLAQDWNVFGTLKFVNGRTIGRSSADKLLRSYWNKMDRLMFGKAAERQNKRVPRWCFAHEGSDSENFHVHFALQAPILTWIICAVSSMPCGRSTMLKQRLWRRTGSCQCRTAAAVASYVTHEYWHMGSDTLLDELCWDRTPVDTMAQYHHDQQAHRITRAASPLWLQQAQQALGDQKAQYEASGDLQMMERG